MSHRRITLQEKLLVEELADHMAELCAGLSRHREALPDYESTLDTLIALARPQSSPCGAWRAGGAAAGGGCSGGGASTPAGFISLEALHAALTACHRDLAAGHFQPSLADWPTDVFHYLRRQAEDRGALHEQAA